MSLTPPSPANDYAIPLGQAATRAFLQSVFSSIGERLRAAEASEADYEAAIDFITTQALALVSANVAEEVEVQRANVAAIRLTLEELLAEYEEVQTGGVPASGISVVPIAGLDGANVQAVLTEQQVVLTAQQAALNLKASAAEPVFSGTALFTGSANFVEPANFYGSYTGTIAGNPADWGATASATVQGGTGGAALMAFHSPDVGAAYFGLDADFQFKVGGISMGPVSYKLWHEGNFNPATKFDTSGGEITGNLAIGQGQTATTFQICDADATHGGAAFHVDSNNMYMGRYDFTGWAIVVNLDTQNVSFPGALAVAGPLSTASMGDVKTYIDRGRKAQVLSPSGASSFVVATPADCNSVRITGVFKGATVNTLLYARFSTDGGATFKSAATDYAVAAINHYNTVLSSSPTAFAAQIIACLPNGDSILPSRFDFAVDTPNPGGNNLTKFTADSFGVTDTGAVGSQYKLEQHGFGRTGRVTHILFFTDDATNIGAGTRLLVEGF